MFMLPGNMLPNTSDMLPGNMLLVSGIMLPVSRQHNYYSFITVHYTSLFIALYPATDGQQTGNNFVADNK